MTPAMDSVGENHQRWMAPLAPPGRDIEGKELRRNFQGSLRFASCSQLRDEESVKLPDMTRSYADQKGSKQSDVMSTRICKTSEYPC